MTYQPEYQSPWPNPGDARPNWIILRELEKEISLIKEECDPLEIEDLRDAQSLVDFLRKTNSI